jgi:hypothetical protein
MQSFGDYSVAEPVSVSTSGVAVAKLLALLFGSATLAAIVVMVCIPPRSRGEWATSLLCTVIGSMGGGSAAVMHYHLHAWADDFFGLIAMGGLFFLCGLPGWVLVRWGFAWVHNNPTKSPLAIVREIRDAIFK